MTKRKKGYKLFISLHAKVKILEVAQVLHRALHIHYPAPIFDDLIEDFDYQKFEKDYRRSITKLYKDEMLTSKEKIKLEEMYFEHKIEKWTKKATKEFKDSIFNSKRKVKFIQKVAKDYYLPYSLLIKDLKIRLEIEAGIKP